MGLVSKNARCRASTLVISDRTENSAAPSDRRQSVGRDQAELVGRLDLVAADEVRHRGVLGRRPEQADALDQEARNEQPRQRRLLRHDQMRKRNGEEQAEAEQVARRPW